MHYFGKASVLFDIFLREPNVPLALKQSEHIRKKLLPYQAAALFILAKRFNFGASRILEIGTFAGYSTSIIAQAAPLSQIITLNPARHEITTATANLARFSNVQIMPIASWDYLEYILPTETFDFIFIDGDHNQIARDLPWYNHLKVNGLMLFHDYHPTKSRIVYERLNHMKDELRRIDFDVKIIDSQLNGLVGFMKGDGETWPMQMQTN